MRLRSGWRLGEARPPTAARGPFDSVEKLAQFADVRGIVCDRPYIFALELDCAGGGEGREAPRRDASDIAAARGGTGEELGASRDPTSASGRATTSWPSTT